MSPSGPRRRERKLQKRQDEYLPCVRKHDVIRHDRKRQQRRKKSIDERLEALATNLEVMSGMTKGLLENTHRLEKLHEDHERWLVLLTKIVARHDEQLGGEGGQ
jgi:hypothetical protein